jgi:hypothetical protein
MMFLPEVAAEKSRVEPRVLTPGAWRWECRLASATGGPE